MKQESMNKEGIDKFFSSENGHGGQVFAGGFLVLMGAIFLLGSLDITIFGQDAWWLFALIPVYWITVVAYRGYRQDKGLSRRVFAILIWGTLPFVYVIGAALGWDLGAIWPVGLIAAGASMLLFRSGN